MPKVNTAIASFDREKSDQHKLDVNYRKRVAGAIESSESKVLSILNDVRSLVTKENTLASTIKALIDIDAAYEDIYLQLL
jgi:hypothetical protein